MIDLCPSTDMIYTDTDSGGRRMEITTKQLDQHGLVVGTFDKFGMGEVIEKRIPKGRNCNLSTSTIIKAMIILGQGGKFHTVVLNSPLFYREMVINAQRECESDRYHYLKFDVEMVK